MPSIELMRNCRAWLCLLVILFCGQDLLAEPPSPLASELEPSPVYLRHRRVATLRAELLGITPVERAQRAEAELERLVARGGALHASRRAVPQGQVVLIDGAMAFVLLEADAPRGESLEDLAEQSVRAIETVIADTARVADLPALIRAGALALATTVLACVLLWGLYRGRWRLTKWLAVLAHAKTEKLAIGGEKLVQRERLFHAVRSVVSAGYWLAVLLVVYEWFGVVFELFPYTRAWGEGLHGLLAETFGLIARGILSGVPNLLIALVILSIAKLTADVARAFLDRVARGRVALHWLDEDSVRPTRRLVAVAIWLFAIAMAYPYLPGAQSEAFKGLSVLLGLMVSLGASSIVGQAASGLILVYSRTLRAGEYIRVGDAEGRVLELGIFSTRIRGATGEDLTVPNSLVLGNITRNRSRSVEGDGYIVEAGVTIGYDTAWRQVHAMLLEAARRTRGISLNPEPRVYQTALSDFYPEYRLVCRSIPRDPGPLPEMQSALLAHIQDVFNEYGVQIMSPHYMDDGERPKVVPRESWSPPPAPPLVGELGGERT